MSVSFRTCSSSNKEIGTAVFKRPECHNSKASTSETIRCPTKGCLNHMITWVNIWQNTTDIVTAITDITTRNVISRGKFQPFLSNLDSGAMRSSEARSRTPLTQMHCASFFITSVSNPRLLRIDTESIHVFLRLYDKYNKEFIAQARQLTASSAITTKDTRPINLNVCVDPVYLCSALAPALIEDAED